MIIEGTPIIDPNGKIKQLINALGPDGRKELHDSASAQLFADVRRHLLNYAAVHHKTAWKLGAQPTGHLEKAAATMQHESSADSATVTINSPGIKRVWGEVTIRPIKAKALTIPVHWLAYGKRVGELQRTMTVYRPKGSDFLATTIDQVMTPLYVLRAAVTLPQDRLILPSDAALGQSVRTGYLFKIKSIIARMTA